MGRVVFSNVCLEVEVPVGTSVLEAAERSGAPEGSRCGGVRACSTCHVYVVSGAEHLSAPSPDELDLIALSAREPRETSRLGCQARLTSEGTVEVSISEESFREYLDKNPAERERAMLLWRRRRHAGP